MVQPAIARVFDSNLPPRPPTPPRESEHFGTKPAGFFSLFTQKITSTRNSPLVTPNSSGEPLIQSSGTSRKKVGWSASTDYHDPPTQPTSSTTIPKQLLQPLPPSDKPIKSILKPYNGPIPLQHDSLRNGTKLDPQHRFSDFPTMLESMVQQLAGKDRMSKMDSYGRLSDTLKASDNFPDLGALKAKMGLLLQFIQRDMTAKTSAGIPDNALIINALTLLASFVQSPTIGEYLTRDFNNFFVDHAVKTLEDPMMSKDIARHMMFLLSKQNFPPTIMKEDRVGRLLAALHRIEEHVKGKSMIAGRLNIYRTPNGSMISSPQC